MSLSESLHRSVSLFDTIYGIPVSDELWNDCPKFKLLIMHFEEDLTQSE